jgi:hypothetical protein
LKPALNGEIAAIVRLHAGQDGEQIIRAVAVAGGPVVGRKVGNLKGIVRGGDRLGSVVITPALAAVTWTACVTWPTCSVTSTRNVCREVNSTFSTFAVRNPKLLTSSA